MHTLKCDCTFMKERWLAFTLRNNYIEGTQIVNYKKGDENRLFVHLCLYVRMLFTKIMYLEARMLWKNERMNK